MQKLKLFAPQRKTFPDPRLARHHGIVDFSDNLSVERLLEAYSFGIFPWPHGELPTLWHCPERRGVLDFSELHVPRSLQKVMDKKQFHCTFNQCFDVVIEACAQVPRPLQSGTWITELLLNAYKVFHRKGYAHSVEVWCDAELAGGLYGTYVAGAFSGESMFFVRPNASKVGLMFLIECLRRNGLEWMDIQMVTPALELFGGKYISRDEFLARLEESKAKAKTLAI